MSYFQLAVRKMFTGNLKSFTLWAIACFVVGGLVSLIPEYVSQFDSSRHKAYFNIFSNIMLGIGTSLLSASLITTIQEIDVSRIDKLRSLFSLKHKRKVAIIVPHFKSDELANTFLDRLCKNVTPEKENEIKQVQGQLGTSTLSNNHASYIGYADFEVVRFIVALFQNNNMPLPEIITDKKALEIAQSPDLFKEYGTMISVGLYSNKFSNEINTKQQIDGIQLSPFFKFTNRDHTSPGNRAIQFEEISSHQKKRTLTLTLSDFKDCCDLCLFSKITAKKSAKRKTAIIICGGLNASGTRSFGRFLYDKWETELCETWGRNLDYEQKMIRNEDDFALVYDIIGTPGVHFDPEAYVKSDPRARV